MEGLIGFLVIAVPIFLVVRHFIKKNKTREEFAALPMDGPMQVNIEESYVPPEAFNSKQIACGFKIDVKISQRDWAAIAQAGLMKKILFYADGASGKKYDPENVREWRVEDLKTVTHASFWDADRMAQAKEQLIQSLHNLRDHIDNVRHGSRKESMQI